MKEEAFLRRRFSLCPPSSTPQKVDPRKLSRNLLFAGDNELYPLSPGQRRHGLGRPLGPGPPSFAPGSGTSGGALALSVPSWLGRATALLGLPPPG